VKPLLKQLTAPMLGLMMRKRVGEVAGLAEAELLKELELKPHVELRTRVPKSPMLRTPFRILVELLVFRPQLAESVAGVDELIAEGPDLLQVSSRDLIFLRTLLPLLPVSGERFNLTEVFRGTDFEAMAQDVEKATFDWQEKGLDEAGLRQEIEGAWRALREQVRRTRQLRLVDTLNERHWTQEEKEQFRRLQQPMNYEAGSR
jgi:hypothetical protein